MYIDTHCHISNEDYEDINLIIKENREAKIDKIIVSGCTRDGIKESLNLSKKYDDMFVTIGYHPSEADITSKIDLIELEKHLLDDKIVGIGEIGLDYHYGKENIEEQKELFRRQLDLAKKYNKPVVIHTRDAFLDTYNILKEYDLTGIIHCFSGSLESAKMYMNIGYYLGIGGVVTFKNSKLKDVIKEIGLDRIVFETDSPYLSPFRGNKNEPCNVKYICKYVSELLNLTYEEVCEKTTINASKVLKLTI